MIKFRVNNKYVRNKVMKIAIHQRNNILKNKKKKIIINKINFKKKKKLKLKD